MTDDDTLLAMIIFLMVMILLLVVILLFLMVLIPFLMVVILLLVMTILFCFSRFDLNLTSVRTEDAGEYFCLVNNKVTTVNSI